MMSLTRVRPGVAAAAVAAMTAGAAWAQSAAEMGPQAALNAMGIVGYADRMSVAPGETIRFMVSSGLPTYRAQIVRLIHGDANPNGPGIKEEPVETPANRDYPGRRQDLPLGSYVTVPDAAPLRLGGSFTITAWIAPTRPGVVGWVGEPGAQGVVTKWAADRGYGLMIDEQGRLALWLGAADGEVARVAAEPALRRWAPAIPGAGRPRPHGVPTQWYFVAATFDAETGRVTLHQEPLDLYADDPTRVVVEAATPVRAPATPAVPLRIAAYGTADGGTAGHYNGKIDNPRIHARALSRAEVAAIAARRGADRRGGGVGLRRGHRDRPGAGHGGERAGRPHGEPADAGGDGAPVGRDRDGLPRARERYGAIHFHDDDLLDAGWEVGFAFEAPADLPSGVYAARLRTTTSEDYVPFFVRPPRGAATASIALLIPTVSYLAYAGTGGTGFPTDEPLFHAHRRQRRDLLVAAAPHHQHAPEDRHAQPVAVHGRHAPRRLAGGQGLHGRRHHRPRPARGGGGAARALQRRADRDPPGVLLVGDAPGAAVVSGAGRPADVHGGQRVLLGDAGRSDRDIHRSAAARRHRALAGGAGREPPQPDGEPGGLWRFRGRAPQWLVGVGFTAQGFDRNSPYRRMPDSFDPRAAFIFEGIATTS